MKQDIWTEAALEVEIGKDSYASDLERMKSDEWDEDFLDDDWDEDDDWDDVDDEDEWEDEDSDDWGDPDED